MVDLPVISVAVPAGQNPEPAREDYDAVGENDTDEGFVLRQGHVLSEPQKISALRKVLDRIKMVLSRGQTIAG